MSYKQNLVRARSHIVFLLAVLSAFGIVASLDTLSCATGPATMPDASRPLEYVYSSTLPLAEHRPLTGLETQWARTAWRYFENNTIAETGLVNSVDGYTATTIWDTASHLMALIAAERLQLLSQQQFDRRTGRLLKTLASLPLFNDQLPNKSYNTLTASMVDYANQPVDDGIGWSAIDIARLLVPLQSLMWNHPHLAGLVRDVTGHWNIDALVVKGELSGATVSGRNTAAEEPFMRVQEGRLGYEEYAARALQLYGVNAEIALDYFHAIDYRELYDIAVPMDSRTVEELEAHNFITSEPFVLAALESGWDRPTREFASRIYTAQYQRYQHTGILTAVSEDHLDQAPWFVYNSVLADGRGWQAMTETGHSNDELKTLSTKAAFAWHAIFNTEYTGLLVAGLTDSYIEDKGWFAGVYEQDSSDNKAITANTNAVVLMSLAYTRHGTLLRPEPAQ